MKEWTDWIKKRVYIETQNNRVYSGTVINVDISKTFTYLMIKDKFGKIVFISVNEIKIIQEEGAKNVK